MDRTRVIASIGLIALAGGTASANFVGLSADNVTSLFTGGTYFGANQANVTTAWNNFTLNGADPKTVYRVYADFDAPGFGIFDVGIVVGGQPLEINLGGAAYSSANTTGLAPDAALLNNAATAAAAFDTFATIGLDLNTGNDQTAWGPFQGQLHGVFNNPVSPFGTYSADQDTWSAGGAPQSDAVFDPTTGTYRVLLAQITVQDAAWISGQLSGQAFAGTFLLGGPELFDFSGSFFIPAPGSVALLTMAGLLAARRRR